MLKVILESEVSQGGMKMYFRPAGVFVYSDEDAKA